MSLATVDNLSAEPRGGALIELAKGLEGLATALAGEPGTKLRRYRGEGPVANFICRVLSVLIDVLDLVAAGMEKVEVWTRLADATLAVLELFAGSIATTVEAAAELVATHARLGDPAPAGAAAPAHEHRLIASLRASGQEIGGLSRQLTDGVGERLPALDDVHRVRRCLASLLERPAPPRPASSHDREDDADTVSRSLVELLERVTQGPPRRQPQTNDTSTSPDPNGPGRPGELAASPRRRSDHARSHRPRLPDREGDKDDD